MNISSILDSNITYFIKCRDLWTQDTPGERRCRTWAEMILKPEIVEIGSDSMEPPKAKRIKLSDQEVQALYSDSITVQKVDTEEFTKIFHDKCIDVKEGKNIIQSRDQLLYTSGLVDCAAIAALGTRKIGLLHLNDFVDDNPLKNFLDKLTVEKDDLKCIFVIGGSRIDSEGYQRLLNSFNKYGIKDVKMLLNPWNMPTRQEPLDPNFDETRELQFDMFVDDSSTSLNVGLRFDPTSSKMKLFIADSCVHSLNHEFADMEELFKDYLKEGSDT